MEIALALGGGGIKGLAHIGVIHRLVQEGYIIKSISGTSAGGMIGAMYATGLSSHEIMDIVSNVDQSAKLFSRKSDDGPSLMGLSGLTKVLLDVIGQRTFDDLSIPFACTAVDIRSGQEMILTHGGVVDAILATIAVPGIFPPKQIGEFTLIDGGVVDPVPVALARWLSPKLPIIAVCLSPVPDQWTQLSQQLHVPSQSPIAQPIIDQFARMRIGQSLQLFIRSIEITSLTVAELRLKVDQPEIIIRPDVHKFDMLDKVNPAELILLGEKAADDSLKEIKRKLSWTGNVSRIFRSSPLPGKQLPIN